MIDPESCILGMIAGFLIGIFVCALIGFDSCKACKEKLWQEFTVDRNSKRKAS